MAGNDVDFSQTGAKIALDDFVTPFFEMAYGQRLAVPTELALISDHGRRFRMGVDRMTGGIAHIREHP